MRDLLRSARLFCAPPKLASAISRPRLKHGGRAQKASLPANLYFTPVSAPKSHVFIVFLYPLIELFPLQPWLQLPGYRNLGLPFFLSQSLKPEHA